MPQFEEAHLQLVGQLHRAIDQLMGDRGVAGHDAAVVQVGKAGQEPAEEHASDEHDREQPERRATRDGLEAIRVLPKPRGEHVHPSWMVAERDGCILDKK